MTSIESISIQTFDLVKKYGDLVAVDKINLSVPRGKIYGFLGPNGAGKTTTLSILSTILRPTSGTAEIEGYDIIKDRNKIRHIIGVCPQELVIYDKLTARENLYLIAQMHKIPKRVYKERADMLLTRMNLIDRADDLVEKFSGGMKRRLNVLMAVIHDPEIIFFDEPSAGLDPQSRRAVWDFIKDFQKYKKTVILTTHNMEEANDLSDYLAIIDKGKIISEGTPQDLKAKIGKGDILEFRLKESEIAERTKIVEKIKDLNGVLWAKELGKERVAFSAENGLKRMSEFYEFFMEKFGIKMRDVVIRQNTLEDVFLALTGRALRD
ncbi:MAG: ATP-binding cassette domain-containing protein [Promethearchaeota archaeon]